MKRRVRRGLMLGGMFLLAYIVGSWVGRFTVEGLRSGGMLAGALPPSNPLVDAREAATARPEAPDVEAPLAYQMSENHVCEGCDARETRDRQLARSMGFVDPADVADDEERHDASARMMSREAARAYADSDEAVSSGGGRP